MSKINFSVHKVEINFAGFKNVESFTCSKMELECLLLLKDNKPPLLIMERFNLEEAEFKNFLVKFHNKGIIQISASNNEDSVKSDHKEDILWRGSVYSPQEKLSKNDISGKQLENKAFFDFLGVKLSQAIGPIADVVLEDILVDMDERKETFHLERAKELIDLLAGEIPRDDKKGEFHEVMMAKLRS